MNVGRPIRVAVVCGCLMVAGLIVLACAQESSPVGPGGECFVASDCAAGLVCVPQRGGARQCTDDLSQVMGRPPPGPTDSGAGDGPTDGSDDGSPQEEGGNPDTGTPDTGGGGMDAAAD